MHPSQSESCLSFYQAFQIEKTSSAGFSSGKSLLTGTTQGWRCRWQEQTTKRFAHWEQGWDVELNLLFVKHQPQVFHFNLNLGVPDAAGLDLGHSCWLLFHIPKGCPGWEATQVCSEVLGPIERTPCSEIPSPHGIWASGAA